MYSSYFGFTRQPFTTHDTDVVLASPAYAAAYDCLRRTLLAPSRGALLLTGEAGSGKTTLLRHLMTDLTDQIDCIFAWNSHLSFEDLLGFLCDHLNLDAAGDDREQLIQTLRAYLAASPAGSGRRALVIDDAQNLPDRTLQSVHELARLVGDDGQPLLRVVLSGQRELEDRLDQDPSFGPLLQDLGGHCRLVPLTDAQVIDYVHAHLRAAGHDGEALFEADALAKLAGLSHGVPSLINAICRQALLLAYLEGDRRVPAAMVREVAIDNPLPALAADAVSAAKSLCMPRPPAAPGAAGGDPRSGKGRSLVSVPRPEPRGALAVSARRAWAARGLGMALIAAAAVLGTRYWSIEPGRIAFSEGIASQAPALTEPDMRPTLASLLVPDAGDADPAETTALAGTSTRSAEPEPQEAAPAPLPPPEETESAFPDEEEIPSELEAPSAAPAAPDSASRPPAPARRSSAAPARDKVGEQVKTLLAQAEQRMARNRYTRPRGQSALDSYRSILRIDPGNPLALRGMRSIKASFVRWADTERARGNLAKAQSHLQTALAIEPGDRQVRARLDAATAERQRRLATADTRRAIPQHRPAEPPPYQAQGWNSR